MTAASSSTGVQTSWSKCRSVLSMLFSVTELQILKHECLWHSGHMLGRGWNGACNRVVHLKIRSWRADASTIKKRNKNCSLLCSAVGSYDILRDFPVPDCSNSGGDDEERTSLFAFCTVYRPNINGAGAKRMLCANKLSYMAIVCLPLCSTSFVPSPA